MLRISFVMQHSHNTSNLTYKSNSMDSVLPPHTFKVFRGLGPFGCPMLLALVFLFLRCYGRPKHKNSVVSNHQLNRPTLPNIIIITSISSTQNAVSHSPYLRIQLEVFPLMFAAYPLTRGTRCCIRGFPLNEARR